MLIREFCRSEIDCLGNDSFSTSTSAKIIRMSSICFLFIFILVLTSCKTDFSRFQDSALKFALDDHKIDEKEYKELVDEIKASRDQDFQKFIGTGGQVDNAKLSEYLVKFLTAKKLPISANDIWQPTAQSSGDTQANFNVDVYIENSASMDGYVKGVTDFETAVYNLLGNIKISGLCTSLNLNYINKKVTYTKSNALAPDIQDFIEKLEPSTFKQRGGDRSVSDLKNILHDVVQKVDDKNMAILISDFVFSPGKNINAQDYLNNQTVGIKIDFAEKLKAFDLSAVAIQLQSNFDGIYYDKNNSPIPLKSKRPYYIWIFGNPAQIKSLLDKKILDNIKGGYQNRLIFSSVKEPAPLDYKILIRPKIGDFKLENGAKGAIISAKPSSENKTNGLFGFNLAVNFSGDLQDAGYFTDSDNYRLSDNRYSLTVEPITESDESTAGFTHKLKLQTSELREETLSIEVLGKMPGWVIKSTSTDDSSIATDDNEKQKTFGLKYLVEGINDAFYPQSGSSPINTLNISIKK